MDVVSHALWGYAATRWRGPRTARWGALLGAAPDLLYSGAALVQRIATQGLSAGLSDPASRNPAIWRADGPPLPQALIDTYNHFYRYTHSLVVLVTIALVWYLVRRRPPWLLLPWALHIVLDIPSHERYQTPFLFPLSSFTIQGISWSRPPMLVLNFGGLLIAFALLYRRYWGYSRPPRQRPWPEQREGIA